MMCLPEKKDQIILETWFIYILGIGQHRHLKFIAKHHNYSIVFDNRLFLLQFQHGPKSISMYNVHCTLFYNPARQLVCIIYTVDACHFC